jgi:hypothetical protein
MRPDDDAHDVDHCCDQHGGRPDDHDDGGGVINDDDCACGDHNRPGVHHTIDRCDNDLDHLHGARDVYVIDHDGDYVLVRRADYDNLVATFGRDDDYLVRVAIDNIIQHVYDDQHDAP